jgi:Holliday junction resolvase RusA-like endonuclease
MVKLTLHTSNCDAKNIYKIEELATAEIELRLEFDRIVSTQSQKVTRDELCVIIQQQLLPFEWICAGSVNLEFLWYLHGTQRQETDKVGDIDNITKPIIDALTGETGLLIDDSQIGSLHTFWNSRNHLTQKDALYIRLEFNNDECLSKKDLVFIQYAGPVCLPLNVNFRNVKDMLGALILIHSRLLHRRAAKKIKTLGQDVDGMLIDSPWDVHRTRLGGFNTANIYRLSEFRKKCYENGLSWRRLLGLRREASKRGRKHPL